MPNLANITVKKNDGTSDQVYTGIRPAAGDQPAVFRNLSVGVSVAQQPEVRVRVRDIVRKKEPLTVVTKTYNWPRAVSNPSTGQVDIFPGVFRTETLEISKLMDATTRDEAISQFLNLSVATKQADKDGASYY